MEYHRRNSLPRGLESSAMPLHMILPRVDPAQIPTRTVCPHADRASSHLPPHQCVSKPLLNSHFEQVLAVGHRCLGCGRTCDMACRGDSTAMNCVYQAVLPAADRGAGPRQGPS